jgi:anti-anti-sigma factor
VPKHSRAVSSRRQLAAPSSPQIADEPTLHWALEVGGHIAQLSPVQRSLLGLVYGQGFTQQEAATHCGIAESDARRYTAHALRTLATKILDDQTAARPAYPTPVLRRTRMQISSQPAEQGFVVLTVTGELDLAEQDTFTDVGLGTIASTQCRTLCIDMAGVTFLDATILTALIHLRDAACISGRGLKLRNPSSKVNRLLTLTGLDEAFDRDDGDVAESSPTLDSTAGLDIAR